MGEPSFGFSIDDAARSYIRLSAAAMGLFDEAKRKADEREAARFADRVRLPGSGAVARIFGRLEASKAARVERQAQAAFERGWL